MTAEDSRLRTAASGLVQQVQSFDWRRLHRRPAFLTDRLFRGAALAVRDVVHRSCNLNLKKAVALPTKAIEGLAAAATSALELFEQLARTKPDEPAARHRLEVLLHRLQQLERDFGRYSQPEGDVAATVEGEERTPPPPTPIESIALQSANIARRKELLGFTAEDADRLRRSRPRILGEVDAIVEEFYRRQTAIEEVMQIIGKPETLERLKVAQRSYILELFSGRYDRDYVANRLHLGLVHKRKGVQPMHYLAGMKTLCDLLRNVLETGAEDRSECAATLEAMETLLGFDTQLVIEAYFDNLMAELREARQAAETYARSLEQRVTARTRELARLSRTDFLTGLLNRRALDEELRRELARARRWQTPLAMVYFDLDGFKEINDTEGHRRGDELLRALGDEIVDIKREIDIACRCGGDEFCVALPNTDVDGAQKFAERLSKQVQDRTGIRMSIGIVQAGPEEFPRAKELLEQADRAMYEQKRQRRKAAAHRNEKPAEASDVTGARPERPGAPASGADDSDET